MILKRKELVEKLTELKMATGKIGLPFSAHIAYNPKFDKGYLYATNMSSILAYTQIETEALLETGFIVEAKSLLEVIKSCPGNTVELTIDGKTLKISSNKYTTNLNITTDMEQYPEINHTFDEEEAHPASVDFIKALNVCIKIAATAKEYDPVLRYVHLTGDRVEATDGYRAVCYSIKTHTDDALIPALQIENILKKNLTHYCFTKNEFLFKTDNDVVFSIAQGSDTYGDRVYEITHNVDISKAMTITNTQDIIDAINRVSIMAETFEGNKNKRGKFRFSKGQLKIMGECEMGSAFEIVEVDYVGKNVQFITTPQFIVDALEEKTQIVITENSLFLFNPSYKCAIVIQQ